MLAAVFFIFEDSTAKLHATVLLNSMDQLPLSITVTIAILTLFLIFVSALKFVVEDYFTRTRLMMTSFFFFIVTTLTISFWPFFFATLPFTIPAFLGGAALGYVVGVRAAEKRLKTEGLAHYMKHFAHVHFRDIEHFNWWSFVNFYTVMSALALINLVGLSTVIFRGAENWAIVTSTVGALLLGSIAPYITHLWSIRTRQKRSSTTSEK